MVLVVGVSMIVSGVVALGLFFALRRSRPAIDQASVGLEARLNAVARSVGAHRMILCERDGLWWIWASFQRTDAAPTGNDHMAIVAEECGWLADALDAAEVWARNLLARSEPSG